MSFLVGPVSGALVAGGIYYGFSNLIQSRTEQHRQDLHHLAQHFSEPIPPHPAPASAAARVVHRPFTTLLKHQWNEKIAVFFDSTRASEERVADWGRRTLYGGPPSSEPSKRS
ncbi:hypothetical protein EVG20_g7755 [Dentipellis fragilis]|uniref:MICOS complex subunit MIC12 n=1 Tax=Dentipellis fragilis TaxID=205917 RepID=A0A4Y9YC06_9AGAM|nr:hypothetical protein EVG20_g7755 [Dentipellis fragilis]